MTTAPARPRPAAGAGEAARGAIRFDGKVATVIAILASNEAACVTGNTIDINGGSFMS